MASQNDVRRIALSLPGVVQAEAGFSFSVPYRSKKNGFAWVWQERIHLKKPRVPNPDVIALSVADETEKQMLIAADPEKFFTEPHYNGFPAVLVRLSVIEVEELAELIADAWRCKAPESLVSVFDAQSEAANISEGAP